MSKKSSSASPQSSTWEAAKELFELCVAQEPKERMQYLNSKTRGNPELKAEVLELLEYHVDEVDRVASVAPAIMELYDNSRLIQKAPPKINAEASGRRQRNEKPSALPFLSGIIGFSLLASSAFIYTHRRPLPQTVDPVPQMPTHLRPGRCACLIVSEPMGASLTLNGVQAGNTPQLADVACNAILEIRLRLPGYASLQTTRTITDPQTRLNLALSQE